MPETVEMSVEQIEIALLALEHRCSWEFASAIQRQPGVPLSWLEAWHGNKGEAQVYGARLGDFSVSSGEEASVEVMFTVDGGPDYEDPEWTLPAHSLRPQHSSRSLCVTCPLSMLLERPRLRAWLEREYKLTEDADGMKISIY